MAAAFTLARQRRPTAPRSASCGWCWCRHPAGRAGQPSGPTVPAGGKRHGGRGGHSAETALTGDTKDQVEAAVLGKYPGATIVRTETNSDSSAPYESHITTSDGKQLEVTVSKDFAVVASNERPAHR